MEVTEKLRQFIGSHIIKDSESYNLLYDGDINNFGSCVDAAVAEDWYHTHEKYIEYKNIKLKFLGDVVDVHIPVFRKEEIE